MIPPPAVVDPRKWTVIAGKPGGGDGAIGRGAGEFWYPWGIAVDGNGAVWVADWGNHRIQWYGAGPGWFRAPWRAGGVPPSKNIIFN